MLDKLPKLHPQLLSLLLLLFNSFVKIKFTYHSISNVPFGVFLVHSQSWATVTTVNLRTCTSPPHPTRSRPQPASFSVAFLSLDFLVDGMP